MQVKDKQMVRYHYIFGFAGLIPFISLAAAINYQPHLDLWQNMLTSYAALIFSFIAGLYWLASFDKKLNAPVALVLWLSILMMLWSWLWVVFEEHITFWMIAISFLSLPLLEAKLFKNVFSREFIKMRLLLSATAGMSLIWANFA